MELSMFCGAAALIKCALLEMREEFAEMKAEMKKIAQLEAKTAWLESLRSMSFTKFVPWLTPSRPSVSPTDSLFMHVQ
jgi:uncharacterized protein YegL